MPGGDIADVVVFESWDRVSVGLRRRLLVGDGPNDVAYGGELLMAGSPTSLDVELQEPLALGDRPLIDALFRIASGSRRSRFLRTPLRRVARYPTLAGIAASVAAPGRRRQHELAPRLTEVSLLVQSDSKSRARDSP